MRVAEHRRAAEQLLHAKRAAFEAQQVRLLIVAYFHTILNSLQLDFTLSPWFVISSSRKPSNILRVWLGQGTCCTPRTAAHLLELTTADGDGMWGIGMQAKEAGAERLWREVQARKAAIVAEERARLLRGAAHLRAYLPRADTQEIARLTAGGA